MDYWMENAMDNGKHVLVDVGYVKDKDARDKADRLFAFGIGKSNCQLAGFGRLLVRIPKSKVRRVLDAFPEIEERCSYSWCTYSWVSAKAN